MALIEFRNLPDTTTPLNAANLNYNFQEILNMIFPVGKVEVFFDNADHSSFMGFTWQRTSVGRVPVGINTNDTDFDTIGNTGGEKTHTLTVNEMPNHKHAIYQTVGDQNRQYAVVTGYGSGGGVTVRQLANSTGAGEITDLTPWSGATERGLVNATYEGGSAAHNIMQPYEVMAFWKRVS